MSIELCNTNGDVAAGLLTDKLIRTNLALEVGGRAINLVTQAFHSGDGLVVVEFIDPESHAGMFQFSPTTEPFSLTAVDADGQPVCVDC